MSSDVVELTSIKDEDLLRHMWQQTEDFGRKKDIRAHMYKLREERLRNFYTGDMDAGIGITKSPMTTSHGDSLTDQSFQSFKTKEIRDSESPTRGYKFDVIAPNTSEWNVVTSSEVTPDGKTHKSHTLATTGAAQNIPGGKQTFSGKNEQLSSDTFEGDDKNFRASSGQSSDTVLKEHVVTGDENSGRIESKTSKTTSSSSFMSTQYQSDGNTPVIVSGAIDHNYDNPKFTNIKDSTTASTNIKNERENLNNINQKCYSTTNQEFMSKQEEQQQKQHSNIQNKKTNSNSSSVDSRTMQRENDLLSSATTGGTLMSRKIEYPDANTKVITETKSLPDGSIITSTKYETRSSAAKNWATSSSSSNKQSSSTSSSQQFINEATSQQQNQQHIVDDQHRTTKRINNNNDNNEYRTTSNNTTTNINRNDQERKLYDEEIIRRDMERDMKRHEQLRRNEYGNVEETTNTTNNKHYYTKDTQKNYETVRNNEILHRDNIHTTEKQFQNNTTKNQQDVTDRIHRIDDSNVRVHRIDDNTVRHHKIDDNNVRVHRIDDNNVQTHKIDDNTVRHHTIDDNNVTVHRIDDNNVRVHRIDDNNIRVHNIDSTVRTHKIDDNNIRVHKIDDNNVRHKDVYVEKFYEIDDHNNKRRDTLRDNHDVEKVYTETEQHRNIRKNIDQSNRAENIEETHKTERRDNVHRDEMNRTVQDKNVRQQKYQYENVPDEMYTQETHKIVKKDLNRNANYDVFTNKRETEPITPTQYNQRPFEHIVTKDDHFSDTVHKEYVAKDSKLAETRVSTESFNKDHFISKRISVDHNPTHEAFARSLRCISPADSSRSLRSSNKSLPRSRTGSDRGRRSPSRDTIISDSSKISSNTIIKNRTDVTKDYRRPTVSSPEKRTPYSTTPNQRKQTTNVEYSKTKDKIKKTVSSETIDIINEQTTTTNVRKPSIPEESNKTSKYKQPSLSPTRPNKPLISQESPNRKSPEKTKPSENLNNTTTTRATTKRDETNINYNTYDESSPDKKQPDTRTTPIKPFDRTKDEIDYVKNKPNSKRFTEDISITYSPTSKNYEDGKERSPRKQSGPRNEPNYMKDTQSSKIRTTDDLSEDELCITNDVKTIKENHTTNYVKDINEMSNKHVTATTITTNDYKKVPAKTPDRHHQVPNSQHEHTKINYDITTKKTTEPHYMKDTKSSKNYHSRTQKDIITTSDDESIYFSDTMTKSIHEKFDTKEPREKYSKSPSPDKISKQIDDKYSIVKDTEITSQSKPRDEPSYMKDTQASKRFSNRTQKDITTSDDDTNYYCADTKIKLTEEKSIKNDYDIPTRKYSKSPSPSRYIKRDDENTLTYLKDTETVSQKKPRDEPSYMKDTQASKRFSTRTQKDITTSEDDSTYYGDTKSTEHSKSPSPNRIPHRNYDDNSTYNKDTEFGSHTKPRDVPNYMKNTESSKHLFNRTTDSQQAHKTIDKSYYNEDNIETFTVDIDKETVNSRRPKSSITDNKPNYQQPTEIFKQSVTTTEKTDKSVNNVYENVRPQKPAQYPVHNDVKPSKTPANKPHGENIPRPYHEAPTKTGSGDQRPKTNRASPQSPTRKSPERLIKDTHKTDVRTTKTRNYRNQNNVKNQSDDDDEYDDVQERESPRSSSPTSTVSDLEYLNVTDYNKHNKIQLNVDENIEITTKQNDYEEITSKKPFYLKEQNTTEKIVENTTDDINDIKKRPTYSRSETYEDRCRKILGMNTTTTDETVTTTQNDANKKFISSEQTVVTDYNQRKTSPQRTQTSPIKDTQMNKPTTNKDVPNSPISKQSSPTRQSSPDEPKSVHKIPVDKSRTETPTSDTTTRKSLTSDTKLYQNLTTDQTTLKKSTDISSIYTKRTSSVSPTRPTTTVTTTTTTTTNKRPSIIENDDSTKKTDKFINEFVEFDNVPKTRKATHADIIDFIKSEKQIFITPSTKPKERIPSKSPDRKSMPENKRKFSPDELAPTTSKSTQDNTSPIANKPINRTTSPTIPTENIMTTNKTLRKQSSDIVVERKISHDNFDKLKPKPQSKTIEIITTDKTNKTKNEATHFTKIDHDHESLKTTTKKSPSKGPISQTPEHNPVSRKSILNDTISTISKPCYTETVTTKLTTITPQKIDKSTSDTKYVTSSKIHISPVKSTTPIIKTSITTKPLNKTTITTAEIRKQKQNIVVKDQQKTKSSKIIRKNHMINEQQSDNESDVESYGYSEDDAPTVIETKTTQITTTNRKIPVTERKDSAPVYRTTKIDKDVKMSRSTSDAIIKTNKGQTTSTTHHTTVRKPSKPDVEITKNVSSKITKTPTKTDTTKRPTKCITTKTINLTTTTDAINSENMENIIIDIQQAKSSREPSPNRIVPIPVSPEEDTGKPRYPDTVHEPDDDTLKRKPKIKNIPIFEEETNAYIGCEISEVTENERTTKFTHLSDIGKVTDSDECMLSVSDKVTKFSNVNQQNTNINRIKEQSNKFIEQTDFNEIDEHLKTDECLLSVHDKVSKFITTAEEVKKPKSSSQLKSPVTRISAQTIDTNVNDKVTKYQHDYTTTAANNVTTTTRQHDIPYKNRTHPNYNEVDIDEELREDECLLSVSDKVNKFITTAEKLTAAAPQKSPELVAKIERQVSRKDKVSESEPDDAPLANKRNVIPKTSITDRYVPQKDKIIDTKSKTPVSSYRTETIQKAKAVFETNPGSTPTPKQRNILSRPSIWEDRRQRETTSKKDVKLTDIGVYKQTDENDDEEDEQEVEELFYEKTNKIITEKNNPKENLTQKTSRTPTTALRKETVTSKRNLFETISTSKTESDKKFDRKSLQVKQQPLASEPESEDIEEKYYSKITKHTERQPNADIRTTTTKITKKPSEISNKSIDIKSEVQRKTPIHSTTHAAREPISPHRSTFERPSDAKPLLNEPKQSVPLSEDKSKPSYMNHTVSSIEHIRRDSIEINKNHLKKSSTHDDDSLDDDNNINYINESPKTAVKFGVELKRTNSQQSQDRRRKSSSSELTQIEEIYDILILEKMLETVVGYELRRRIRSQIRLVRKELGEEVIVKKTYICTDDSEQSDDQKVQRTKVTQHFGGVPRKSEKLLTNNITPTPKRTTTFDESSIITTGESEYTSSYSRNTQNNERADEIDSNKTPIDSRITSTRNEYRTSRSPSPKSSGKTITTTKEYITPRSSSPGKITTTTSTKQYITPRSPSPKSSEKIISTTTKEYRTSRSPSPKLAAKTVTTTTTTTTTRTKESGTKPITTITTKKTIQRGDNDVKDDKPIWATKNILKKASETQRKSYKMNNQSSTKKIQEKLKTTDRTEDCVISSYGIGPTDENGKPLFGIRALKKKTQPVETSKVAGVIIKETLYSENGSEPIGKRTITQYSSDPNDVVIMDGHINNEITTEEFNASNYKYNNKLNQKGIRNTITDTFGDDYVNEVEDRIMSDGSSVKRSTRVVRRGSVKELSEKFIQKESQYEHEQPSSTNTSTYTTKTTTSSNTYPKSRYTLRSQMESSRASTPGSTSIRSESVDFDECDVEIRKPQTTSTHKRTVIESVGNDDGHKYTTTTTTTSSSAAANKQRRQEQTRSFTNSKAKITGVQDCLNRMSNADNIEEMGDTEEDKEARALLNKFLGASVLMTGVETMAPTEITHIIGAPSVKQKTIVKNQRNVK